MAWDNIHHYLGNVKIRYIKTYVNLLFTISYGMICDDNFRHSICTSYWHIITIQKTCEVKKIKNEKKKDILKIL